MALEQTETRTSGLRVVTRFRVAAASDSVRLFASFRQASNLQMRQELERLRLRNAYIRRAIELKNASSQETRQGNRVRAKELQKGSLAVR